MDDLQEAYLDDLIINSNTWEDHLKHVRVILQRLREAGLTVKPTKYQFGIERCVYLGHVVGGGIVQPEASKVETVKQFAVPEIKKQVRAFLGITASSSLTTQVSQHH